MFTFNAEEEVLQLISREVEQEQTVEETLPPKYHKISQNIVCGAVENIEMLPLLPAASMEGTSKKLLDGGNGQRKEQDEPRDGGGHRIDKPKVKDAGEENNQTCGGLPKKGANEMEIKAPISPIKNIVDEKVSTENGLTKKDSGSANNERRDSSFTHQVAKEGDLQPKDLKNVSVQAKTIKRRENEVCHKCDKVYIKVGG